MAKHNTQSNVEDTNAPESGKHRLLFVIQWRDNTAGQSEYKTLKGEFATAEEATAKVDELKIVHPEREYKIVPPVAA